MNKAVVAVIVVAGLGVGGVAGAAAFSGKAVTGRMEEQARKLIGAVPVAKIVREEKKSGLFSSTYDVTLRFGCFPSDPQQAINGGAGPLEPIELTFHNEIKHGPLPDGKLGLAAIDSEIRLPDKWQKRVEEVLGKQPVLKAHSTVNFQGEYVSEFSLPGVKGADKKASFELKPIKGKVTGKSVDNGVSPYQLEIPSIEAVAKVEGDTFAFNVANVRSEGEVNASDKSLWLSPGQAQGSIDSVKLTGAFPDFNALMAAQGAQPNLQGMPKKPFTVLFSDFKFSTKNELDKAGLFSTQSDMTFKGKVNDFTIDKVESKGSLKRMHAATYQHLMQEMMLGSLSCDPAKRAAPLAQLDVLMKDGIELLKHNPEYALDKLGVVLDGKDASISYALGAQGITTDDMLLGPAFALLRKGYVKGSLRLHTALLTRWMELAAKLANDPTVAGQAPSLTGGANAAPVTPEALDALLKQASDSGYVVREGEYVTAAAEYKGGQLSVNGKPLDMPALPTGP